MSGVGVGAGGSAEGTATWPFEKGSDHTGIELCPWLRDTDRGLLLGSIMDFRYAEEIALVRTWGGNCGFVFPHEPRSREELPI